MRWLAGLALLLVSAAASTLPLMSATMTPLLPQGEPLSGGGVRDPDFGVVTRQFGLDRRVEMYQWSASKDGYRRVWNAALIDSSGFAPGHENPPELPLASVRWWAQDATLDGKPLHVSVLGKLGRWRQFRPGFRRLPANLAATFEPEGDGLGSAENPLDPQIGDLRVSWRELVLPSLVGEVTLRDGVWYPISGHARPLPSEAEPMTSAASSIHQSARQLWPWILIALLPVMLVVAARRSRARNKR